MSIWTHRNVVRIDWWRVVTDLMQAGMSQRDIGAACEVDHAAINRLRNEVHAQPIFGTGVRLLALWMERCERGPADIPRADGEDFHRRTRAASAPTE